VSSAIYCLNDIIDVEADRAHPTKCKRPIASGKVSVPAAISFMLALLAGALAVVLFGGVHSESLLLAIIGCYFVLNIAYSCKLKNAAVLDAFIISTGFVLRIFAGGACTGIPISNWIVMMTFLLTLFLAMGKRKDDVLIYKRTGVKPRENTGRYSEAFIDLSISFVAAVTMVCYIMYTMSPEVIERMGTSYLYLTSVFVLGGIIRYLQLSVVDNKTGNPTKILLKDRFIQGAVLLWAVAFVGIIYVR